MGLWETQDVLADVGDLEAKVFEAGKGEPEIGVSVVVLRVGDKR